MRTFFATMLGEHRHSRRKSASTLAGCAPRPRPRPADLRAQEGFLLIEVLITTLLVALMVVATYTGFDDATQASADQRRHAEATLLAAQSQEQLRSDPATALDALESTPRAYTKWVGGTLYTITQEAKAVSATGKSTGCTASEASAEHGANILITSSVTWPQLVKAKRPSVKEASIISPPVGSALEVDVTNAGTPAVPESGVTAVAKFTPVGSTAIDTVEGTTGSTGCVVLTGLATTTATVEIDEKPGFITTSGKLKYPTKEVSIAPNITTQYDVTYAPGGRIEAVFTYEGETTSKGKSVTGDTFVVSNSKIPTGFEPFEVGSTSFAKYEGTEEQYTALTGSYASAAATAAGAKYPHGDLFPFPQEWSVYAGSCSTNSIGKLAEAATKVESYETAKVKVPLSRTELSLWSGSSSSNKGELEKSRFGPLVITQECSSSALPDNAFAAYLTHEQKETLTEGRLEDSFQPFGPYTLCLVNKAADKTYAVKSTNTTTAGSTPQIYIGEKTGAEKTKQGTEEKAAKAKLEEEETNAKTAKTAREKAETEAKPAKEKREKEETEATTAKAKRATEETAATTAKEKRTKEETEATTAKTSREKTEKEAREKWESEEKSKKISKATRETDEKNQTTTRVNDEAAEKTAKEKRTKEETEATTAKDKRATEETAATTAKEKRVTEEAEAGPAKTAREKEETEAKTAKTAREKALTEATASEKAREKEETNEAAAGVTVGEGTTC